MRLAADTKLALICTDMADEFSETKQSFCGEMTGVLSCLAKEPWL